LVFSEKLEQSEAVSQNSTQQMLAIMDYIHEC